MSTGDDSPSEFDELAEEYVARVRAGEQVDPEEYATAHPAHASDIRKLFPVLAMMEGSKAATVAEPAPEGEDALPAEVDGYRIVRELGRGGMGRVLEAERDGARYAIKMIHPHLAGQTAFLDRFLREAEVGTRVVHDNVVRTIAAGTTATRTPYLVMEYVEGQNLRDLLEEVGRVPERLARHIGQCVAEALSAIHAEGIVHRDVKPENVVITPDEQVKLMDLGVALVKDEATRLSQTGEFVGSLLYAAPEQIRGRAVDGRADIYSLGLLLFELVTGEHALHEAGEGLALPLAVVSSPSPREQNRALSPFYDELTKTLLALEPDQRIATAPEVAQVLAMAESSAWWRHRARPDQLMTQRLGHDSVAATVAFHGREAELETLDQAFADVRGGEGRVVVVQAEGGLGKSRLVREWLAQRDITDRAQLVVAAHASEGERFAVPPLARAFADLLGTVALEERLHGLLGPSACLAAPFARFLLGEQAEEYSVGLPPTVVNTATVRLARGLAREAPLVLVIEDLHRATDAARDLCLQVARGLGELPALVILTQRPDGMERTWQEVTGWAHATPMELSALEADACYAVLDDLADDDVDREKRNDLVRRADGNPLYLLELLRSVTRVGGEAREAPESATALPGTLRELLTARLDELTDDERELLEMAACFGAEFDPVLVADALEAPRMQTLKAFGRLDRNHGLLESAGRSYRFAHHLIQETLYAGIHEVLRETYHGAIARALYARAGGDDREPRALPGPTAVTIANHALVGGEHEIGLRLARHAMEFSSAMQDVRAQLDLGERVLALGDALDPVMRAAAKYYIGDATFDRAGTTRCMEQMTEVLALLEKSPDAFIEREALITRAVMHRFRGDYELAFADFEHALDLARASGDHASQSTVLRNLAGLYRQQGRREESMRLARESLAHAQEGGSLVEQGSSMNSVAIRMAEMGAYQESLRSYDEALDLARQCGKRLTEASVLNNTAEVLRSLARHDEALARTTEALEIAREVGNPTVEGRILRIRARVQHDRGELEPSHEAISEIVARLEGLEQWEEANVYRVQLGVLEYDLGRLEDAQRGLEAALEYAQRASDQRVLSGALLALAEVYAARGDFARAARSRADARQDVDVRSRASTAAMWMISASRCALFEGDFAAALEHAQLGVGEERAGEERVHLGWLHAHAAIAAWQVDRRDVARVEAESAITFSADSGIPGPGLLGSAVLAAVGIDDVTATRIRLEQDENRLPWWARMLAWWALAEVSGAAEDRSRACAAIVPAAADPDVIAQVPLYRAVADGGAASA